MKASDWISVKETKPPCNETVLIRTWENTLHLAEISKPRYGIRWARGEYFDIDGHRGGYVLEDDVTHWMPIVLPRDK